MRDRSRLVDKVCELNVVEQAAAVGRTAVVRDAWARTQRLAIHGWIYGLSDGLLRDLNVCVTRPEEIEPAYERGIADALSYL